VIAAAIPRTEIASIVSGCGIVTEPECARGFADAITALAGDTERRQQLGAAGRAYAERVLDSQTIFDRLDTRLRSFERQRAAPRATASAEEAAQ